MAGKLAKHYAQQAPSDEVLVWPENLESVNFFLEFCQTQWRSGGMGGPTGLDYTAVLACLRTLGLARDKRDAMFADVRIMEGAALSVIHAK
ncbi:DUF1799 domain-containing protein [Pulveribacter sp.]|uniref:DUF1799 domain-containing protein n=1 Tax=Pulveribacter sp. TaxID=2678893 RepID=UPI0028AA1B83|nr:DUF1799 domain-containing protein [Pulveribacter sp.]